MPKFNADEAKSLNEPIEFTLNGKEYKIDSLMPETLRDVQAVLDDTDSDNSDIEIIHSKQLGILTGEDPAEFMEIDVRKTTAVLSFVMDCVTVGAKSAEKKDKRSR